MINNLILSDIIDEMSSIYPQNPIWRLRDIRNSRYLLTFKNRKLPPIKISLHPKYHSTHIKRNKYKNIKYSDGLNTLNDHIENKVITSINQSDMDRIISFELSDNLSIIIELFPPSPDLYLTHNDEIIYTLLKGKAGDKYTFPEPPESKSLLDLSDEGIMKYFKDDKYAGEPVYKIIRNSYREIDTEWAKLFSEISGLEPQDDIENCSDRDITNLEDNLQSLKNTLSTGEYKYHLYRDEYHKPQIYVEELEDFEKIYTSSSPSDAQSRYIEETINYDRFISIRNEAKHLIESERDRMTRKLSILEEELKRTTGSDDVKKKADLIMNNLSELKKGQSKAELLDPETSKEVMVELDRRLSPYENAVNYYNLARRLERGISKVKNEIVRVRRSLKKLPDELPDEVGELKALVGRLKPEMTEETPSSKERERKKNYYEFELRNKFKILIGKNRDGNDHITFRLGKGNDLWFHVRDFRGSHGILKKMGQDDPTQNEIAITSSLVAYFSKAKRDSKVEVSYTKVKHVKRAGAKGRVLFTNEKTILVKPLPPDEISFK